MPGLKPLSQLYTEGTLNSWAENTKWVYTSRSPFYELLILGTQTYESRTQYKHASVPCTLSVFLFRVEAWRDGFIRNL